MQQQESLDEKIFWLCLWFTCEKKGHSNDNNLKGYNNDCNNSNEIDNDRIDNDGANSNSDDDNNENSDQNDTIVVILTALLLSS